MTFCLDRQSEVWGMIRGCQSNSQQTGFKGRLLFGHRQGSKSNAVWWKIAAAMHSTV